MYFSTLLAAISLFYALPSSAQDLSGLPSCAQGPTLQSIGNSGCQLTDIACICKNEKFIDSLTPQIQKACSPADLAKVEQFTAKLCGSVGVTVASAASVTSAATAAGSAASSAAGSATSSRATATSASSNQGADVATSSVAAATASSSSAADGGQVALLREGAISWCVSAIFLGVGGAWVLRGL